MSSVATHARVYHPPTAAEPSLHGKPLLEGVTLDFGPIDLLGRFFLAADTAARARGVYLTFGGIGDLLEVNRCNPDTWRPLLPIFDPTYGGLNNDNSFSLLGRNAEGDVIATQAARLYAWTHSNIAEEAANLRLFYPDPARHKLPTERIDVTAPSAASVTGRVAYSGGVWFRPDFRGRFLTAILPRISRAYAFTRWYTDVTTTFMAEKLVENGVAARCGYTEIGWDVALRETRTGSVRAALLTMRTAEMLNDLSAFLQQIGPQIDGMIDDRTVQQPHAAAS